MNAATSRFSRLFGEAQRELEGEIRAITHRNAAKGLLRSGGTIKEIVRGLDETAMAALTNALGGIATLTFGPSRKRNQLLEELVSCLEQHRSVARTISQEAIARIGLANDFKHALPLIGEAERRQLERIEDFREGWTAPAAKPWKELHPLLYDGALVVIGATIGIGFQALVDLI